MKAIKWTKNLKNHTDRWSEKSTACLILNKMFSKYVRHEKTTGKSYMCLQVIRWELFQFQIFRNVTLGSFSVCIIWFEINHKYWNNMTCTKQHSNFCQSFYFFFLIQSVKLCAFQALSCEPAAQYDLFWEVFNLLLHPNSRAGQSPSDYPAGWRPATIH